MQSSASLLVFELTHRPAVVHEPERDHARGNSWRFALVNRPDTGNVLQHGLVVQTLGVPPDFERGPELFQRLQVLAIPRCRATSAA